MKSWVHLANALLRTVKAQLVDDPVLSQFSRMWVAILLSCGVIGVNAIAIACGLGLAQATTKADAVVFASAVFALSPLGFASSFLALLIIPGVRKWATRILWLSVTILGVTPFLAVFIAARFFRSLHDSASP